MKSEDKYRRSQGSLRDECLTILHHVMQSSQWNRAKIIIFYILKGLKIHHFTDIEVNNCLIINPTDAQRLVYFFQQTENGWQ